MPLTCGYSVPLTEHLSNPHWVKALGKLYQCKLLFSSDWVNDNPKHLIGLLDLECSVGVGQSGESADGRYL